MSRTALKLATVATGLVVLVGALLFISRDPVAPAVCRDTTAPDAVNVVRQLRAGEDGYELELWSEKQFPERAMPTIVRIGTMDLGSARFGGFDPRTIVLTISPQEYDRIATGDPILVHHTFVPRNLEENPDLLGDAVFSDGANLWGFGRFDKSQLGCPAIDTPETGAA